jgi:hypothetical protein
MTFFYSKKDGGFYVSEIHTTMPDDVVEISEDHWKSLLEDQGNGKIISADSNGNPVTVDPPQPTKEQIIKRYNSVANNNFEAVVRSWGYNSMIEAASFINSTSAKYRAEAEALIVWRDSYWTEADIIEAGELPATEQEFVALLPKEPKKPIV